MQEHSTCSRGLGILDYDTIHIIKFVRMDIPPEVEFPATYAGFFFSPNFNPKPCQNDESQRVLNAMRGEMKLPKEIAYYFDTNPEALEFRVGSDVWKKEGAICRLVKDTKELILAHMVPYFNKLETLVGQTVPISEALPGFSRNGKGMSIPQTTYFYVGLKELGDATERKILEQENLPIPDLGVQDSAVAFYIAEVISRVYVEKPLAVVGGLAYEGFRK